MERWASDGELGEHDHTLPGYWEGHVGAAGLAEGQASGGLALPDLHPLEIEQRVRHGHTSPRRNAGGNLVAHEEARVIGPWLPVPWTAGDDRSLENEVHIGQTSLVGPGAFEGHAAVRPNGGGD